MDNRFEAILAESEVRKRDLEQAVYAIAKHRSDELSEMVDLIEGRKNKREKKNIQWRQFVPYLVKSYQNGVDYHEMARYISAETDKDVDAKLICNTISTLGISKGNGRRNGLPK